ncbi:MAG TPA: hypothetical protein ENH82_17460 [bacterium]|nr:hypothetical protein [bacterium]
MNKNNAELIEKILEKSYKDGTKVKLTCTAAFEIADRFGINPNKVGSLCNERNIRISHCQLGCFK